MLKLAFILASLIIADVVILYHFYKKGRNEAKANNLKRTVNSKLSTNN